jgi:hypothetical protein
MQHRYQARQLRARQTISTDPSTCLTPEEIGMPAA